MCEPMSIMAAAAVIGAGAATHTALEARQDAKHQRKTLLQAEADRKQAEATAAQNAQAAVGDRRRRMRSQSLLTSGAAGPVSSGGSALSYGKSALGQ